jgi:hypothetical protein
MERSHMPAAAGSSSVRLSRNAPRLIVATPALALGLALSHPLPAGAQAKGLPTVEVAAGGGFVGARTAEVVSRPAVDCDAAGACTPVPGFADLIDNSRTVWRPALATGLILRWSMEPNEEDKDKKFGLGVGGQMVFTPQGDGTRLLPAVTFHAGTRNTQFFFGFVFGSTDRVRFPGEASSVRVADGVAPSFIEPHGRRDPSFFLGIVIEGAAVKGASQDNPPDENE